MKMKNTLSSNRGQIIVFIAFVIALLMVTGVTVINTATISETQRASGPDLQSHDATDEYHNFIRESEQTIKSVNHDPTIDGSNKRNVAISSVEETAFLYGIQSQQYGTAIQADIPDEGSTDVSDGTRVTQVLRSDVTSVDGDTDWVVVNNAENIRAVSMNIESVTDIQATSTNPFEITLTESTGNSETISISDSPAANTFTVQYNSAVTGEQINCDVTEQYGDSITLDFIAGKFLHRSCPEYPIGDEPIESISISNGDRLENTRYSLVATDTGSETFGPMNEASSAPSVYPSDGDEEYNGQDPVRHPAVYSIDVGVRVSGHNTLVEGDVVLAPGTTQTNT